MRILIYEYLTGGGLAGQPIDREDYQSLLTEGRAMVEALVADLLAAPAPDRAASASEHEYEPVCFRDARLEWRPAAGVTVVDIRAPNDEFIELERWAHRADAVVLIAPEFDGILLQRSQFVERHHGCLLSPSPEFIEWTADKSRTAKRLAAHGVPVPAAETIMPGADLPTNLTYPLVLKRVDGAGSFETRLVHDAMCRIDTSTLSGEHYRLEEYCRGTPVSVAALASGTGDFELLSPCRQAISEDGRFRYRGGCLPIDRRLAERATALARRVFAALPAARGYVGIDLILGADSNGADDVVLEINPRLTTSYVGLRHALRGNLAQCMIDMALDRCLATPLEYRRVAVHFDAEGRVRVTGAS